MKTKTPQEAVTNQRKNIALAIELLQSSLDDTTDSINPDKCTWDDMVKFAHISDLANEIIERYEEN